MGEGGGGGGEESRYHYFSDMAESADRACRYASLIVRMASNLTAGANSSASASSLTLGCLPPPHVATALAQAHEAPSHKEAGCNGEGPLAGGAHGSTVAAAVGGGVSQGTLFQAVLLLCVNHIWSLLCSLYHDHFHPVVSPRPHNFLHPPPYPLRPCCPHIPALSPPSPPRALTTSCTLRILYQVLLLP